MGVKFVLKGVVEEGIKNNLNKFTRDYSGQSLSIKPDHDLHITFGASSMVCSNQELVEIKDAVSNIAKDAMQNKQMILEPTKLVLYISPKNLNPDGSFVDNIICDGNYMFLEMKNFEGIAQPSPNDINANFADKYDGIMRKHWDKKCAQPKTLNNFTKKGADYHPHVSLVKIPAANIKNFSKLFESDNGKWFNELNLSVVTIKALQIDHNGLTQPSVELTGSYLDSEVDQVDKIISEFESLTTNHPESVTGKLIFHDTDIGTYKIKIVKNGNVKLVPTSDINMYGGDSVWIANDNNDFFIGDFPEGFIDSDIYTVKPNPQSAGVIVNCENGMFNGFTFHYAENIDNGNVVEEGSSSQHNVAALGESYQNPDVGRYKVEILDSNHIKFHHVSGGNMMSENVFADKAGDESILQYLSKDIYYDCDVEPCSGSVGVVLSGDNPLSGIECIYEG